MHTRKIIKRLAHTLKSCLIGLVILLAAMPVTAQLQWGQYDLELDGEVTTVYADTGNDLLYVGGKFGIVNGHKSPSITVYDGVSWDTIGNWYAVGWVYAIAVYHDTLFIGGYQGSSGGLKKWSGTDWIAVGGTEVYGQVYDLEVIDDELWVAGNFDSIGDVPGHGLARWDGSEWKTAFDFPGGLNGQGNPNWIVEITKYKGEIYVGGNFNPLIDSLSSLNEIARWNGQQWTDVGGGIKPDGFSAVNRMMEYEGDLYVMGGFIKANGNADDNIMRWNGDEWLTCGGGINYGIYDAVVHKGKLWVTGGIESAGGVMTDGLAIWDGAQWCSPGNEYDKLPAGIGVYRDTLVMGGAFTNIDGENYSSLAYWDGAGAFDSCGVLWPVGREAEPSDHRQANLYPNPVKDILILELPEAETDIYIQIISSDGQVVYSALQLGSLSKLSISTERLKPGLYLLQLHHSKETQTHRFIKH